MVDNLDPRQIEFLKNYLDPKSDTFSHTTKSAKKAGFSDEYGRNITALMPNWLSESLNDEKLVKKAEKNLDIFLEGEDAKIRADITKFVLSRLNKKKYSERVESTGKDGESLFPKPLLGGESIKE